MLDAETVTFLTSMRDSIESKIQRVEDKVSDLSREVGEQTVALDNHQATDAAAFRIIESDHQGISAALELDRRTLRQKLAPSFHGSVAAAVILALVEFFKSSDGVP